MGWLVLKVNPDPAEDRWCIWSTIVEAPIFEGPEKELIRYYVRAEGEHRRQSLMDQIARAKVHGSGTDWDGDWEGEDPGMIYKQMGVMPRDRLGAVLDIMISREGSDQDVRKLLMPFED
jgi:hypothetical protein